MRSTTAPPVQPTPATGSHPEELGALQPRRPSEPPRLVTSQESAGYADAPADARRDQPDRAQGDPLSDPMPARSTP